MFRKTMQNKTSDQKIINFYLVGENHDDSFANKLTKHSANNTILCLNEGIPFGKKRNIDHSIGIDAPLFIFNFCSLLTGFLNGYDVYNDILTVNNKIGKLEENFNFLNERAINEYKDQRKVYENCLYDYSTKFFNLLNDYIHKDKYVNLFLNEVFNECNNENTSIINKAISMVKKNGAAVAEDYHFGSLEKINKPVLAFIKENKTAIDDFVILYIYKCYQSIEKNEVWSQALEYTKLDFKRAINYICNNQNDEGYLKKAFPYAYGIITKVRDHHFFKNIICFCQNKDRYNPDKLDIYCVLGDDHIDGLKKYDNAETRNE